MGTTKKRILVTGATGAIGAAVCGELAGTNTSLCLHYFSNHKMAMELEHRLRKIPDAEVSRRQADLSDAKACQQMVDHICHTLGGIDIVINAAGQARDNPLFFVSASEIEQTMRENFATVVNICEAVAPYMAKSGFGRIVNFSSITGVVGQPMRCCYAAAKGAVIAYSKSIARELAPHGITVNCITPQVIGGGLAGKMKHRIRTLILENTPLGRECAVADVVSTVSYLADEKTSFVTGETINVTGGLVTWS